jgi:hypothetical protein
MRLTVARLKRVACAMRTPVQRSRPSCSARAINVAHVPRGERCGRKERPPKVADPPSRKRRIHLAADCRLSLNSTAASLKPSSPCKTLFANSSRL